MLCNNISFSYKYLTITFFTAFVFKKKKFSQKELQKSVCTLLNIKHVCSAIWESSGGCLIGFLTSTKLKKYLNFKK